MDRLINDLYKKNIIQIKKTELKNGSVIPIQINFLDIFEYPILLEEFLVELNNFIVNNKINYDFVIGKNDFCKNVCTLLSYKFKFSNILRENIYKFRANKDKCECLLIKENMGCSKKTSKIISTLNSFNINVCKSISLINYNTKKTTNDNLFFLDIYKIIQVLYKVKVLDYNKFLDFYVYLSDNSYLNFQDRLTDSKSNVETIIQKIIGKKTLLIFCCSIIQKLEFKDLIRTLDFVGKHVSIVKMENLYKYNEIEIKSLIKLCMHHNFKILSKNIYDTLNFIQLIKINELLDPKYEFDNRLYIIDDKDFEYTEIKLDLFKNIKNNDNIIGIITNNDLYLQENKLKIFNITELEDNILENKLIKQNYDLLVVNSTETLVSLKHLSWNLYEKKKT